VRLSAKDYRNSGNEGEGGTHFRINTRVFRPDEVPGGSVQTVASHCSIDQAAAFRHAWRSRSLMHRNLGESKVPFPIFSARFFVEAHNSVLHRVPLLNVNIDAPVGYDGAATASRRQIMRSPNHRRPFGRPRICQGRGGNPSPVAVRPAPSRPIGCSRPHLCIDGVLGGGQCGGFPIGAFLPRCFFGRLCVKIFYGFNGVVVLAGLEFRRQIANRDSFDAAAAPRDGDGGRGD
jgi:hypothetical protein